MEQKDVNNSVENKEEMTEEQYNETDIASNPEENAPVNDQPSGNDGKIAKLEKEVAEFKDKYLRQAAEFDNFRKRTAKERLELIQTASKDLMISLLDVLDDMERAQKQIDQASDPEAIKQGVMLVFNKSKNILQAKGLKAMESIGQDFDPDMHEAITEVPAPNEKLKGKVLDEVQKGYYLNDKIIRFAKVVVGK